MRSILLVLTILSAAAFGEVRMPAIFGDHMVLQQDMPLPIWGKAAPGEAVTVALDKETVTVKAGADGKWKALLKAHKADGKTYSLTIKGSNTLAFTDVVFGEVWVGSGQSNMEWSVRNSSDASNEMANAAFPMIRLFTVKKATSLTNVEDVSGAWAVCAPSNIGSFSAALYFFGKEVHKKTKLPLGLINTSWGGTPAEAWTGIPGMAGDPVISVYVDRYSNILTNIAWSSNEAGRKADYEARLAEYNKRARVADPGNAGEGLGFAKSDFDDSAWPSHNIPCLFQDSTGSNVNGAIWYRKTVDIPAAWEGKALMLNLSSVDDYDTAWVNGVKVGSTGSNTANWWTAPRRYEVPAALVKAGKLTVAVRVFDDFGKGGMNGNANEMNLIPKDGSAGALALSGAWKWKFEYAVPVKTLPPPPVNPSRPQNFPSALWNAMVAPLVPFAVRGVVWYQGESNAGKAFQYRNLFSALIKWWRKAWQPKLHFYWVSLANYTPRKPAPGESEWAELREAQSMALRLPDTGTALAIDIGQGENIHPTNKQAVGLRLALHALAKVYGQKVAASGPRFQGMKVEGASIRLSFSNTEGALMVSNADGSKELRGFAIAGDDRKFSWAKAEIMKDQTVRVRCAEVAKPVAVRYGWAHNPEVSLYNKAWLPADPFRTDAWDGLTVSNR